MKDAWLKHSMTMQKTPIFNIIVIKHDHFLFVNIDLCDQQYALCLHKCFLTFVQL